MTKTEELLARLKGRRENSWRTAVLHADPQVRHDAEIRAQAYENAMADAKALLQEFKAGQTVRHKKSGIVCTVDAVNCAACHCPHDGQAGQTLQLRYKAESYTDHQITCTAEGWEIVQ